MIRENYVSLRRSGVYIAFSETMEDSQIEMKGWLGKSGIIFDDT